MVKVNGIELPSSVTTNAQAFRNNKAKKANAYGKKVEYISTKPKIDGFQGASLAAGLIVAGAASPLGMGVALITGVATVILANTFKKEIKKEVEKQAEKQAHYLAKFDRIPEQGKNEVMIKTVGVALAAGLIGAAATAAVGLGAALAISATATLIGAGAGFKMGLDSYTIVDEVSDHLKEEGIDLKKEAKEIKKGFKNFFGSLVN